EDGRRCENLPVESRAVLDVLPEARRAAGADQRPDAGNRTGVDGPDGRRGPRAQHDALTAVDAFELLLVARQAGEPRGESCRQARPSTLRADTTQAGARRRADGRPRRGRQAAKAA